jgi:gas vesicle protein
MGGNSKFLAGILLGAAAGAAIALFLNTEKGKEIMEDIKDAAGKAGDNIKDAAKKFGDEVASVVEKGKGYAGSFGEKADEYAPKNG